MLKYKIPQIVTLTPDLSGEPFYDMYDNKKGSLSANLCALRLGLEPRTL